MLGRHAGPGIGDADGHHARGMRRPHGHEAGRLLQRLRRVEQQVEEDLQTDQIEGVTIHYASRIEDVLALALPKSSKEAVEDEVIREEVLSATT